MTRYLAYCQGDILLTSEGSIPFCIEPYVPLKPWNVVTTLHLGSDEVKIIRLDKPVVGIDGLEMVGLRKTYALLSPEDYQLAGKGAELLYWDGNTKYCGVCGAPTRWMTDISKKCTECGKEWWPSVSTAIIVRITRIRQLDNLQFDHSQAHTSDIHTSEVYTSEANTSEAMTIQSQQLSNCKLSNCPISEVLLVRSRNFRGNKHGLVAGFLETGESLEECVEREVREETGIKIKNLRYFGSQPWPYPFGLMVGFTADYESGELHLQKSELCEGGWFTRDNLPEIPDKASIARRLIDDWLNE